MIDLEEIEDYFRKYNSINENHFEDIIKELKAVRKVVEAARPLVRALELCQVYRQDENIYKAFKNEIVLQLALKELDGEK